MDNNTRAVISNAEVGQKIGLTHTAVSRLRSGDRNPGIATMKRIEDWLGWNIGRQINHILGRKTGVPDEDMPWHEAFERQLRLWDSVQEKVRGTASGKPEVD